MGWMLVYQHNSFHKEENQMVSDTLIDLLTVGEIQEYTGMSKTKIWSLILDGELISLKIGGNRRVRKSDLIDYLESFVQSKAEIQSARDEARKIKQERSNS